MKILILIAFLLPTMLFAQQTYVPDDNFEQALIYYGYDEGPLDDYVPTANIDSVTELTICYTGISDLTGIEDFVALEIFDCSWSQLTTLDFSHNINLEKLNCEMNKLTSLDLTHNIDLKHLWCHANELTSLDLSHNIDLTILSCYKNELTSLDLSHNIDLTILSCYENELTSLDLSHNIDLEELYCNKNELTSLDLSHNIDLTFFWCHANELTSLDLRNGNNINLQLTDSRYNDNLFCIQVDDPSWSSDAYFWEKDDHADYSEDCSTVDIEESTPTFSIFPNPATDFINIETESLSDEIEIYNMLGISVLKAKADDQIDVSGLPRGIYFVKIGNYSYITKVILH